MSYSPDIAAYFDRIGYEGTPTPSIETLRILHAKHPQAIPFENINPLLGLAVELDTKSLEQKLIHNNRGGYCFEHNLLFKSVLEAIGFPIRGLAARVRWGRSEDETTPRGHMLLLVEAGGKSYIADVGFGGSTLTAPLLLKTEATQSTPHESYRLVPKDDEYLLQIKLEDEWKALYQFTLQENFLPDYKLTNWYLSNHPESHFVNSLKVARAAPGQRYVLSDNVFKIHRPDGETQKQELATLSELQIILEQKFNLALPDINTLKSTLKQKVTLEKQTL